LGAPNTHTRVHDLDYRTTRVTSDLPVSGSQPYFDKQFSWDAHSRIASIADVANSALDATYGYDSLDRVTSASQGAAAWGYTYNGIGDRLTSTDGANATTYGYFSGTHRLQSLSGAQSKSYTFDAAGNMTGDGTTPWTYGGSNRPTSAGSVTFLINALGQRVKKTAASSSVRFVYDEAGRLWGEYDGSGSLIQETVWLTISQSRPCGRTDRESTSTTCIQITSARRGPSPARVTIRSCGSGTTRSRSGTRGRMRTPVDWARLPTTCGSRGNTSMSRPARATTWRAITTRASVGTFRATRLASKAA
jgi:hypothetical protein